MSVFLRWLYLFLLFSAITNEAFARKDGVFGYNRENSRCAGCHIGGKYNGSTIELAGPTAVTIGESHAYTLSLATNAPSGGFNLAASDGLFAAGVNSKTNATSSELTHDKVVPALGGALSWNFSWQAPDTVGTVTYYVCINQVDGTGGTGGDNDVCTSFAITVSDVPPDPDPQPQPQGEQAPIADAGPDQSVKPGSLVVLSAANSYDPDGYVQSVRWTQLSGNPVELSATDKRRVSFFAPAAQGALEFKLEVKDNNDAQGDVPRVDYTVVNVMAVVEDFFVTAEAVGFLDTPVVVTVNDSVTLNAAEPDPEGDYSYSWRQLSGPSAALSAQDVKQPSFTPNETGLYVFDVTIKDFNSGYMDGDRVYVNAVDAVGPSEVQKQAPTGESSVGGGISGERQKALVTGATDADGAIVAYRWRQTFGPPVTFSDPTVEQPYFVAPPVRDTPVLQFEVLLIDNDGLAGKAMLVYNVQPNGINDFRSDWISYYSARQGYPLALGFDDNSSLSDLLVKNSEDIPTDSYRPGALTHGLTDMKVNVAQGATATIVTYFKAGQEPPIGSDYIAVDANDAWVVVPNEFGAGYNKVTVHIADGGPFDRDGQANGTIQFLGGTGTAAAGTPGKAGSKNGSSTGSMDPGWLLLALVTMGLASRKRAKAR